MKRSNFNFDWTVRKDAGRGGPAFGAPPAGEACDLPIDTMVTGKRSAGAPGGAPNGFFENTASDFTKHFDRPAEDTVFLQIDGAYMNAEIDLNGERLMAHPYGYTPVLLDLTENLRSRDNVLKIRTAAMQPGTRWYSGCGLYRDVSLWTAGPVFISPWDLFVRGDKVSEDYADIVAKGLITNKGPETRGTVTLTVTDPAGEKVGACALHLPVYGEDTTPFTLRLRIEKPKLWSPDSPDLYQAEILVRTEGGKFDSSLVSVGLRSVTFDPSYGMKLNGEPILIQGGNVHHDHAMLGAASFAAAEERRIKKLKEAGYNAIRCSHNPPSEVFLEACDRLGMLIMDEAFDCFEGGKNLLDYHLYFKDWWERDIETMVRRDRNHPSVIFYSVGNEIQEYDGTLHGEKYAHLLADKIRSLDPTRPVTGAVMNVVAMQTGDFSAPPMPFDLDKVPADKLGDGHLKDGTDLWGPATEGAISAFDICSMNYLHSRFERDAETYPDRIFLATESLALRMYDNWQIIKGLPQAIGDFTWTAWDNLGEAGVGRPQDLDHMDGSFMGPYPWLSCDQGDFDMCGERKPQSWYRSAVWGRGEIRLFATHPDYVGKPVYGTDWEWERVEKNYTYGEAYYGKDVRLTAYTDADAVIFTDSEGEKVTVPVHRCHADLVLPYKGGLVRAEAVKEGKVIASDVLEETGPAVHLAVLPEKTSLAADGMDLVFVTLELQDAAGRRVYETGTGVKVSVEGAGSLAGLGSGETCTDELYGTGCRKTFDGRVMAVIRAGRKSGDVSLTADACGLPAVTLVLPVGL